MSGEKLMRRRKDRIQISDLMPKASLPILMMATLVLSACDPEEQESTFAQGELTPGNSSVETQRRQADIVRGLEDNRAGHRLQEIAATGEQDRMRAEIARDQAVAKAEIRGDADRHVSDNDRLARESTAKTAADARKKEAIYHSLAGGAEAVLGVVAGHLDGNTRKEIARIQATAGAEAMAKRQEIAELEQDIRDLDANIDKQEDLERTVAQLRPGMEKADYDRVLDRASQSGLISLEDRDELESWRGLDPGAFESAKRAASQEFTRRIRERQAQREGLVQAYEKLTGRDLRERQSLEDGIPVFPPPQAPGDTESFVPSAEQNQSPLCQRAEGQAGSVDEACRELNNNFEKMAKNANTLIKNSKLGTPQQNFPKAKGGLLEALQTQKEALKKMNTDDDPEKMNTDDDPAMNSRIAGAIAAINQEIKTVRAIEALKDFQSHLGSSGEYYQSILSRYQSQDDVVAIIEDRNGVSMYQVAGISSPHPENYSIEGISPVNPSSFYCPLGSNC